MQAHPLVVLAQRRVGKQPLTEKPSKVQDQDLLVLYRLFESRDHLRPIELSLHARQGGMMGSKDFGRREGFLNLIVL